MEKGEKMDCDSMTTVNVKDFGHHTLDYQDQEPPPVSIVISFVVRAED
jgi:hypothetical protein